MAKVERDIRPTPTDGYPSPTSTIQAQTENILRNRIPSTSTLPSDSTKNDGTLQRNSHLQFLLRNLVQGFPARYVSQDASQPWLIFWTLQGFSVLGVGLDEQTKRRAIDTLLALQHPDGGFCGGPGQFPHLLPTYAAVSALAIVGKPGENGGWDQIDQKKCYDFFMSLKQPDGSFLVSHDAEVDVRGIYCLLTVATMLNMLTPELLEGTPEFIASCQTYEGGFGSASFPGWAIRDKDEPLLDPSAPRPPLGEAHGGYTFCATASWIYLQPYLRTYYDSSSAAAAPKINTKSLLRWATHMQGLEIELGGFKGRTNKLVDGCYSWWVGGCVGLVEGLLGFGHSNPLHSESQSKGEDEGMKGEDKENEEWDDVDDSLFNRKALQEYILYAGQHPAGGLVDKPPKVADSYHTLYCLSGLSAAQHRVTPSTAQKIVLQSLWKDEEVPEDETEKKLQALRKEAFASSLSWLEEEGTEKYVGGSQNRLNATHPLFNLTVTHSEGIMAHFYGRQIPSRASKSTKK
ncbi:terpenoid cyclases/Protein prenyltransferase [Abortiporus biennis]|nr:terpenoid cyclases/Protein prenyltransferase [Abortiporus biennis]